MKNITLSIEFCYQYDDKIQLYISFKSLDNYCIKALVNAVYLIIPRVY